MVDDWWRPVFHALADRYRRRLLVLLLKQEDAKITVPEEIHDNMLELTRLQLECYHRHLPMLVDYDLIEWNEEAEVVSRGDCFSEIVPILECLHTNRDDLPDGWV